MGTWSSLSGGETLYTQIDETSPSDGTDAITSASGTGSDVCRVNTNSITDPVVSDGHILRMRARRSSGTGGSVNCRLYSAGGLIGIYTTIATISSSFRTFEFTLSGAEADSITSYSDIDIEFVKVPAGFSCTMEVSWAEFEVPNISLSPSFIASAETLYAPSATMFLSPGFIASAETLYAPGVEMFLLPGFIASAEALYAPLAVYKQYVDPPALAVDCGTIASPSVATTQFIDAVALATDIGSFIAPAIFAILVIRPSALAYAMPSIIAPSSVDFVTVVYPDALAWIATIKKPIVSQRLCRFYGIVDDVRIFDEALTNAQVAKDAMRAYEDGELPEHLILYWRLNTGSGTTATDETAGGHNGTISGTGNIWVGFEGQADMRGQRKPVALGVTRSTEPVEFDPNRLVYQVADGAIVSTDPREGGFTGLTFAGNVANVYSTTVMAGQYKIDPSRGMVRFGATPADKLAFDIFASATYTIRDVIRAAAAIVDKLDLIDDASLLEVEAARPGAMGLHLGTGAAETTLADVLDRVMDTVDGWWQTSATGTVVFGLRSALLAATVATEDLGDVSLVTTSPAGVRWPAAPPIVYPWTVRYRPYEVTMEATEIAGAVPAGERAQWLDTWRSEVSTPLPRYMREAHADKLPKSIDALWDARGVAWRDAYRRGLLDRHPRRAGTVEIKGGALRVDRIPGAHTVQMAGEALGALVGISVDFAGDSVTLTVLVTESENAELALADAVEANETL
jgi:hypothetical protein